MTRKQLLFIGGLADTRDAYAMAGLSHFFDIDIFSVHYSYVNHGVSYLPYYDNTSCIVISDAREFSLIKVKRYYDMIVVSQGICEAETSPYYNDFEGLLTLLHELRKRSDLLIYVDNQEKFFFEFTTPKFWDVIDYHFKHQLFKIEHGDLLRQDAQTFTYHSNRFTIQYDYKHFPEINRNFHWENHIDKIRPFPFGPSILDNEVFLRKFVSFKRYDITMNFRNNPVSKGRYCLSRLLSSDARMLKYSIHVGIKKRYCPTLKYKKRKYGVAGPYRLQGLVTLDYVLSLLQSKMCLGLGLYGPSLRLADCFKLGVPLLNWDMSCWDYGIPLDHDHNYISIGRRETILENNSEVIPGAIDRLVGLFEMVLQDRELLARIQRNAFDTAQIYFSSPKQFARKVILERVGLNPD